MNINDLPGASVDKSVDIPFFKGGFELGQTSVTYFSTCLQARQLTSMLQLPSQLPVDPANPIRLEELFQRELDIDRVTDKIVPYLRNESHLKFFNALTVALLPLEPENPRRLARKYPSDAALAPPGVSDWPCTSIGPITVSHQEGNENLGYLTWNLDMTMPVVLDGQHRFRAIQLLLNETSSRAAELAKARVSVLFLVLDERVGFRAGEDISVLAACREIFIDLNKHAMTVPRARLALLDDRDVRSVAMRSILADGVALDDKSVSERVENSGQLPLGLVDWRGASAKFDRSAFVTSLLTLQDMVEHVLAVPRFGPLDHARARQAVDALAARLALRPEAGFDLDDLQARIDAAEAAERPFELPRDAALSAGKAFGSRLGPRVVQPLVRLRPYAALIEELHSAGLLGTRLEPWLSFNADERAALLEELDAEDPAPGVERVIKKVKDEQFPLAFQVVFQKAFVYSLNSIASWPDEMAEYWGLDAGDGTSRERSVIDAWIGRFNEFLTAALAVTGSSSAFLGAGVRAGGDIEFRKTRIRTITGFVSYAMLAPLSEWTEERSTDSLADDAVAGWVAERWAAIAPGPRGPLTGLFSLHGKNWRNGIDELVRIRAGAEGQDLDEDERAEARIEHAAWQLNRLIELASAEGGSTS